MPTILLVEPNVAFRRMMEQELRKAGHEVFGAAEVMIAARALREREFDLVMIEMVIPGDMTAADLLAGLRDDPTPGDPARVAMTAQPNFASQESFFRAEYALDGFLLKPFLPAALRKAIDAALESRARRKGGSSINEWNAASAGFAPPPLDPSTHDAPVWPAVEPPAPAAAPAVAIVPPAPPPVALSEAQVMPRVPVVPPPAPWEAPAPVPQATPADVDAVAPLVELATDDLVPLETNPGLVDAPAPSATEFAAASEEGISLEALAPPPQTVERRAVERFAVRVPLAIHDGKSPFRARSENLGRGGVFVVTDRGFPPGTPLRARLELPIDGAGPSEIAVRVVHAERANDMTGLGLRFEDMSAETARRLDAFLTQLAAPSEQRPFLIVASQSLSAEVERVVASWRGEETRVRMVSPRENVQEIAESDPPDLMVLDLTDPVMVAFVGALKATRATSGIPIALVDRSTEAKSALLAAAAGADRYFPLPGEVNDLIAFAVEKLSASRRRSVRVRFQRPVKLWVGGVELPAAAIDLSETGIQVRTSAEPPDGAPLELAVLLSDGGVPLRLATIVQWKAAATDGGALGVRLGLAFQADESTRARVREEIRRALAASYYVRWLAAAPRQAKAPAAVKQGG